MNAEFLAVGTEILLGDIVNTNAQFISKELSQMGINMHYESVCGDNPERLSECLDIALGRCDLVILTGGLGPTYDDLTKETVAKKFGLGLEMHEESLQRIRGFFQKMGRTMTDNNIKQAMMPVGATIFQNDWGTAPACGIEKDGKVVVMLPGPPREMKPLFDTCVRPFLLKYTDGIIVSHNVRIYGKGESSVETELKAMMTESTNPTIAPYAKDGEVSLRVTAKAKTQQEAEEMIAPVVEKIKQALGDVVYGVDVDSLQQAAVEALRKAGKTVSTAESCTAGLLGKRITELPGSSEVYVGGVVTYSNEMKEALLGVPHETLEQYGAVSEQTARSMAENVRRLCKTDLGVAITGIAGPGGGTPEKPVGLVYIAVADETKTEVKQMQIGRGGQERELVRYNSASAALDLIRRMVRD